MPNTNQKHHLICVSGVRSSPKWTIGGRGECGLDHLGTPDPGPGSYGQLGASVRNNIGFGFGSGQRSNLGQSCDKSIPGAGLYNPKALGGGPSDKPRGGRWGPPPRRPDNKKNAPPGPGSYDISTKLGQKATKIGPAVYGRRGKDEVGSGNIGPGHYKPMKRPSSAPPAWSFGTSQRPHPGRNAGIDPAVPGLDAVKNTSPGLSTKKGASMKFRSELDAQRWELRPEPASYSAASTLGKGAQSFGRAERPSSAPSRPSNVGPGSYNVHGSTLKTNGTSGFTSSNRGNLSQCDNPTGPGQYEVRSTVALDKGYDMTRGSRSNAALGDPDVPGPGYYALPGAKGRTPKWSIHRSRQQPRQKATEVTPSPSDYGSCNGLGGLVCSIGQGLRPPLQGTDQAKPGPGAYSPCDPQSRAKGVTQKGRWKDPVVREVAPTPQTYEADYTSFGY